MNRSIFVSPQFRTFWIIFGYILSCSISDSFLILYYTSKTIACFVFLASATKFRTLAMLTWMSVADLSGWADIVRGQRPVDLIFPEFAGSDQVHP